MKDVAALTRTGLIGTGARSTDQDPRIRVSLSHLRGLEGQAKTLHFLPRQPARSVLNGRHASRLRGRGLNFEELRGYLQRYLQNSTSKRVSAEFSRKKEGPGPAGVKMEVA